MSNTGHDNQERIPSDADYVRQLLPHIVEAQATVEFLSTIDPMVEQFQPHVIDQTNLQPRPVLRLVSDGEATQDSSETKPLNVNDPEMAQKANAEIARIHRDNTTQSDTLDTEWFNQSAA